MSVLEQAPENLASLDLPSLIEAAKAADARRAFEEAAQAWMGVVDRAPNMDHAWLAAAGALRNQKRYADVEALLIRAEEKFPASKQVASTRAWNAMNLGDWEACEEIWRRNRERFPDDPTCFVGLGYILRRDGRADELESLCAQALSQFPGRRDFELLAASVPVIRRNWPEAEQQYRSLREKYPQDAQVVVALADALKQQGRLEQAETVLSEGAASLPDVYDIASQFAQMAVRRQAWSEAVGRWDVVVAKFPDRPAAYVGMGAALRGAKFAGLHAVFMADAAARFPDDEAVALEQVMHLVDICDWDKVRGRMKVLAEKFPNSINILSRYGQALLTGGLADEAEAVLSGAMQRFRGNVDLQMNFARAAGARLDWKEAVKRWSALAERQPHNPLINTELGRARYNLELLGPIEQGDQAKAASPAAEGRTQAEADIALVTKFESLGEDCEFGLFQREVRAEPLGLLRFAGTAPKDLVAALQCRLDGVGSPEFMVLETRGYEYVGRDQRFGMTMHTHINPRTAAYEATRAMMLKKTQYLKRKLIEDLEEGAKIFVYKDRYGKLDNHYADLRAALNQFGKPRLLVVKIQEPGKPDRHLEARDADTLIGYVDRHGYDGAAWTIPVESWLVLCRKACAHWGVDY